MQRFEAGASQPPIDIRRSLEHLFLDLETEQKGRTTRKGMSGIVFGGHTYNISHAISNGRFYSQDERVETYTITDQEGERLDRYSYQPDSRTLLHNGEKIEDEDRIKEFQDLIADVMVAKAANSEAG